MNRIDELTLKLIDQTIDDADTQELADLTKTPEGREALRKLLELESFLQASGRDSIAESVHLELQRERCDRIEAGVMRAVGELPESAHPSPAHNTRKNASAISLALAGIAALAACLLFVWLRVNEADERAIAHLNLHGSIVRIVDAEGQDFAAPQNEERLALRQGQTIETSQAIDSAEIVYSDGTRIELLGETKIRVSMTAEGSKQVDVLSGLIHADVSPQPQGQPLRIVTRTATLEVLGTTLGVEVRDASTQLGVATGLVAMTRNVDGQRVEVEAGRYATATESAVEPFETHPFPDLPHEWSEDFEAGLPDGWRTGEWVDVDGANCVRATKSRRSDDGRFVITSHNAWQEGDHGLCEIDEDSVLHLRIRQSEFARITIMIGTRSYPPATGRVGGNLFYTKKAWNEALPADTWRTITVPLSDVGWHVKQGKRANGPPDLEGLAAYLIHINTMTQDAGLIIDRIWITDGSEEQR